MDHSSEPGGTASSTHRPRCRLRLRTGAGVDTGWGNGRPRDRGNNDRQGYTTAVELPHLHDHVSGTPKETDRGTSCARRSGSSALGRAASGAGTWPPRPISGAARQGAGTTPTHPPDHHARQRPATRPCPTTITHRTVLLPGHARHLEAWSRLQPHRAARVRAAVSGWGESRGGDRAAPWTTSGSPDRGCCPPGAEERPDEPPRGPPRRGRPGRPSSAVGARTPPRAGRRPSPVARSGCARAAHRGRRCAARRKRPAGRPQRWTRCRHRSMWRLLAGGSRFGCSAVVTSPRQGISNTGFDAPVRDPTRPSW